MKINKKPGIAEKRLIAALIVVVALLVFLVPTVNAYTYNGYKWTFGTADWRFSSDFPDGYEQSVKNAANTWSNAGSAFTFNYDSWEITSKVDWTDLGSNGPLGTTTTNSIGSVILWVVTDINSAKSWTTSPGSSYPPYDIETTALHEFGHWLSLGHSSSSSAVMYQYYMGQRRSLTQDDINGINYIYP